MAREAVIVESLRTGLTKAHRGSFNMTEPVDYTAHALKSVVEKLVDPAEVEDVIIGCGMPEGCQGMNTARIAAMAAGFPKGVAATTVNRFCSSGSQAVMMAAHQILHEGAEVAIGAGVETITMMQDGTQNTNRMVNSAAKLLLSMKSQEKSTQSFNGNPVARMWSLKSSSALRKFSRYVVPVPSTSARTRKGWRK